MASQARPLGVSDLHGEHRQSTCGLGDECVTTITSNGQTLSISCSAVDRGGFVRNDFEMRSRLRFYGTTLLLRRVGVSGPSLFSISCSIVSYLVLAWAPFLSNFVFFPYLYGSFPLETAFLLFGHGFSFSLGRPFVLLFFSC